MKDININGFKMLKYHNETNKNVYPSDSVMFTYAIRFTRKFTEEIVTSRLKLII